MLNQVLLLAVLKLGAPFSDGMVLQRQMPIKVWGSAAPKCEIRVKLDGDSARTMSDANGRWLVELPPRGASKKPVTMTVKELAINVLPKQTDEVEVKDILVGEVWFASGQSNMECPIWGKEPRYRDEKGAMMVAMTQLPNVRFVVNQREIDGQPQASLVQLPIKAQWRKFTPEELAPRQGDLYTLSAVAFYFAREIYLATDVPVGIVQSAWSGTPIEPWTPPCATSAKDLENHLAANGNRVDSNTPTALFNGLVADYCPMAMRGVIWYQGCNNKYDSADKYREKMHALYDGWSKMFENPDLKLYFAQLAPYRTNWMNICMAQAQFAAEEKNATLVVLADVGNFVDIHPNRKDIVGQRLAMHALKRDYGFEMPGDESPILTNAVFAAGTATLEFANASEWYVYSADLNLAPAFELCGDDGEWKAATLVNEIATGGYRRGIVSGGPELVLKAEGVADPKRVRYLGRAGTAGILYNELSLPLGPFETK